MPERIAILSDIHGNLPALRAVYEDVRRAGCARVFLLGDIVNGLDPGGCVELVREWGEVTCLKGNAEYYVLTPDLAALPGREEPEQVGIISLIEWIRSHLRSTDLAWLRTLPDLIEWDASLLVHDSPVDRLSPERWHRPGVEPKYQEWFHHSKGVIEAMTACEWADLLACMESRNVSRVFCGHSHLPFMRRIGEALVCNVGSVGLPLDGDPRPSWALLEALPGGGYDVGIRRVAYDVGQMLHVVDATPDYPNFERPAMREAYRRMLATGQHWRLLL